MSDKQTQKSGDGSVNIQARDIQLGVSYKEARQIAQDVFDSNFYKLAGEAQKVARARADEILEKYLNRLAEQAPDAIKSATDPDMQYALFTAQKEYARIGDKDLADVLVDILVDRAAHNDRSLIQIVLNESLNVVPKLTPGQIDVLSIIFILRYSICLRLQNMSGFASYIRDLILPFIQDLPRELCSYQHIEYCNCGTIQITTFNIEQQFIRNYPGLFDTGLTKEDADKIITDYGLLPEIIVPCVDFENKFCFIAPYDDKLSEICKKLNLQDDQIKKIIESRKKRLLKPEQVKAKIIELVPETESLFKVWNESALHQLTLTSVGIAIAHANIRRKTNQKFDLNIWIK